MNSNQSHHFSKWKRFELRIKSVLAHFLTGIIAQRVVGMAFKGRGVPFHGFRILVDDKLGEKTRCNLLFRMYESAEIRFVTRYLPTDRDVVELGSSIGVLACIIRRKIEPYKRLICVEANGNLCRLIKANLSLNKLEKNVEIINSAVVGDHITDGFVYFEQTADSTTGYLSHTKPSDTAGMVTTRTLDEIVAQSGVGQYTLVCDIEGAEWDLIKKSRTLQECYTLIIEFHNLLNGPGKVDIHTLVHTLEESHGFEVVDCYGPVYAFKRRE